MENISFHIHYQETVKSRIGEDYSTLISVSEFISKDWEKYFQQQGKNKNFFVLPNCVDEERFNKKISLKERAEIRNKVGFKEDDFVIIFCGRIAKEKGIKELIKAVVETKENVKLMIVGGVRSIKAETSPYLRDVKELVDNNPDKIKFTGYVKNSELFKYYQAADLQAAPSLWEEAAGLVVLEGQYSGLPQIITQSGGMSEFACKDGAIIIDKEKNVSENIRKAIEKIYKSPELRKKMIEANAENCKKYTKHAYYKNFLEILEKL